MQQARNRIPYFIVSNYLRNNTTFTLRDTVAQSSTFIKCLVICRCKISYGDLTVSQRNNFLSLLNDARDETPDNRDTRTVPSKAVSNRWLVAVRNVVTMCTVTHRTMATDWLPTVVIQIVCFWHQVWKKEVELWVVLLRIQENGLRDKDKTKVL